MASQYQKGSRIDIATVEVDMGALVNYYITVSTFNGKYHFGFVKKDNPTATNGHPVFKFINIRQEFWPAFLDAVKKMRTTFPLASKCMFFKFTIILYYHSFELDFFFVLNLRNLL